MNLEVRLGWVGLNSSRRGVFAPALRHILSEGMDEQPGGGRLNGDAAHRRVEFGEVVAVGGIVAENFQLPFRHASCMDHEGLEVVPLEILILFRVDWPCERMLQYPNACCRCV